MLGAADKGHYAVVRTLLQHPETDLTPGTVKVGWGGGGRGEGKATAPGAIWWESKGIFKGQPTRFWRLGEWQGRAREGVGRRF